MKVVEGIEISPQQRRLWQLGIRTGHGDFWARIACRLVGPLDAAVLHKALEDSIERAEIFSCRFVAPTGARFPLMVEQESKMLAWDQEDWLTLPEDDRLQRRGCLWPTLFQRPLPLTEDGAPVRAFLVREAPELHRLVLTAPAMMADAESLWLLAVAAVAKSRPLSAREVEEEGALSYLDVSAWLNEALHGEEAREGRDFWRHRAPVEDPMPAFPFESLATPAATAKEQGNKERGSEELSSEVVETWLLSALEVAFESEGGAPLAAQGEPEAFTLSCWLVLLSRLWGQRDVVLGVELDGRNYGELEGVVGPLVRTVPLRWSVQPQQSFQELMAQVGTFLEEGRQWQECFASTEEAGEAERNDFSALFAWQRVSEPVVAPAGAMPVVLSLEETLNRTESFCLQLVAKDKGNSLKLYYRGDRITETDARRIGSQLGALLGEAAKAPLKPIEELFGLGAEEKREILEDFQPDPEACTDASILELLLQQAVRTPEAPALVDRQHRWTYGELVERVDALAVSLQRAGVGPEAVVALYGDRRAETVVALLAILRAGGAYLPLDPTAPPQRLQQTLTAARVSFLLREDSDARDEVWASGSDLGLLELRMPKLHERPQPSAEDRELLVLPRPESLAYVLFTSGSTGRPKGVAVEHRQLYHYVRGLLERFDLAGTRCALVSTLAADLGNTMLFGALCSGGCLHVFEEAEVVDPDAFSRRMSSEGIQCLKIVPSHCEALLAAENPAGVLPRRWLFFGGEVLPPRLVGRVRDLAPQCRVVNHYGPTETTVGVLAREVAVAEVAEAGIALGNPLLGTAVAALGRGLQPAATWAVGELCVGGAQLSRGYLGAPRDTAERFVPNPLSSHTGGGRLYRTGDRVRRRTNGRYEFLGRGDHQIKLRGFRIELGEIETVLRAQPEVREAVVVVRGKPGEEGRLVAYVVRSEGVTSAWDARQALRRFLPEPAVPGTVVELSRLPLTSNGKVDRGSLPKPEHERRRVAPRNAIERRLATIFGELLGVADMGVEDDFFRLGGDSILSIQAVARAHRVGLSLSARDLFRYPTIAEIASRVTVRNEESRGEKALGPVPLTPIQRWFFETEHPEPYHFNQTLILCLRQPLDARRLRNSLQVVAAAHEAFRLRFRREADVWVQELVEEERFEGQEIDLSTVSPEDWKIAFDGVLGDLERSLNLEDGPLFRAGLVRGPEDQGDRMILVAHHLVVDGVSWRILLDELNLALEPLVEDEASVRAFALERSGFKAWAEALRTEALYLAEQGSPSGADLWSGAASLPREFTRAAEENTVATLAAVEQVFDESLTNSLLGEALHPYRARLDDLLLTALAMTFLKATGAESLVVELEGHGREESLAELDLSRTVGWFTSRYPVRLTVPEGVEVGRALMRVKESLRGASRGAIHYGLNRYFSPAASDRGLSRPEERDPEISYNNFGNLDALSSGGPLGDLAPERSLHSRSPRSRRRQLLEVVAFVKDGRLQVRWLYSEAFHRRSTIEAWSLEFGARLRELVDHCRSEEAGGFTPSDFPLAKLHQEVLDLHFADFRQVEDLYPLSPLQEGILFHSLQASGKGSYISSTSCTLKGGLNSRVFRQAWELALRQHSTLRTAFLWQDVEAPVQVVHGQLDLPWQEQDWSHLEAAAQKDALDSLFARRLDQGFSLDKAPLFDLHWIRLDADTYRFFWFRHHLLLDGWATALLFREILTSYRRLAAGEEVLLPQRRPYRDYIAWLGSQDLAEAESYWREALAGFRKPTALPFGVAVAHVPPAGSLSETGYETRDRPLSAELAEALRQLVRHHGLTLNTLGQGFWALLLAHGSGNNDVLFGSVGAGRPAELEASNEMIGMFINSLPVRLQIHPEENLLAWLRALQTRSAEQRQFEYTPLVKIQAWSEVPASEPLFESFFVFENYPLAGKVEMPSGVEVQEIDQVIRNSFPLTLRVMPEPTLRLDLLHDLCRVSRSAAEKILDRMEWCLAHAAELMTGSIAQVLEALAVADEQDRAQVAAGYESAVMDRLKASRRGAVKAVTS